MLSFFSMVLSMRSNVQMVLPSTFFFARHQHDTLRSLPPGTRDVAARDSSDKRVQGTEPDIVNGSILQLNGARICLLALF